VDVSLSGLDAVDGVAALMVFVVYYLRRADWGLGGMVNGRVGEGSAADVA